MAEREYYISAERKRWQFEIAGELFGPYSTLRHAIAAAQEDANLRYPGNDPEPEIFVRTAAGDWRLINAADSEAPASVRRRSSK